MAQWIKNLTSIHEDEGSIPGLIQLVKGSSIAMSCGVIHRRGLDLELLWLWHRLAAAAPTQPLAQEFPYAADVVLKEKKKKEWIRNYKLIYKHAYHSNGNTTQSKGFTVFCGIPTVVQY